MVVNQAKQVMFVLARSASVRRYIELVGLTELDVQDGRCECSLLVSLL